VRIAPRSEGERRDQSRKAALAAATAASTSADSPRATELNGSRVEGSMTGSEFGDEVQVPSMKWLSGGTRVEVMVADSLLASHLSR
jgi:hypothetical protein